MMLLPETRARRLLDQADELSMQNFAGRRHLGRELLAARPSRMGRIWQSGNSMMVTEIFVEGHFVSGSGRPILLPHNGVVAVKCAVTRNDAKLAEDTYLTGGYQIASAEVVVQDFPLPAVVYDGATATSYKAIYTLTDGQLSSNFGGGYLAIDPTFLILI